MELFEQLKNVSDCKVGELFKKLGDIGSGVTSIILTDDENDKTIGALVLLRGNNVDKILNAINEANDA